MTKIKLASAEPLLNINNFSVSFHGKKAVSSLTLPSLPPQSLIAVLGPNGSGKTSLLKGLASHLPYQGKATYRGYDLSYLACHQARPVTSYLPQQSAYTPHISVLDLLSCTAHVTRNCPGRLRQFMKLFGLEEIAHLFFDELSGGQQQITTIAQLLISDAPIILLDEPLNNLDVKYQYQLLRQLRTLAIKEHKIIFLTIHDLNMALQMCPSALLLSKGQKIAFGPSKNVLSPEKIKASYDIDVIIDTGATGKPFIRPKHPL